MRFSKYILQLLAACAALALPASVLEAAGITYHDGDLVAAFSTAAGPNHTGNTYLLDFANVSAFETGGLYADGQLHNVNTTGANILSDLSAAGINSLNTATWSLQASDFSNDLNVWLSHPETTPGSASTPFNNGQTSIADNDLNTLWFGFGAPAAASTAPQSFIQATTDNNSYASYNFGSASPTQTYQTYGNSEGTLDKVLDLYAMTDAGSGSATLLGAFDFNISTGVIRFSSDLSDFVPAGQNAVVALDQATYSVTEAQGAKVTVTVNRTGKLTNPFAIQISTTDGTAKAGTDYTAVSTSLAFAANDATKTIDIPIAEINGFQGDRSFTVALSNAPSGVSLGSPNSGTVTIHDSTPNPHGQLAFASAATSMPATDSQGQPNHIMVALTRAQGSSGAVSAQVSVAAGGKLVNGTDYTFTDPTTVNFADGVTTQNVEIDLKALAAAKLPGTIKLALSNPTGMATLGLAATTVTVTVPDKTKPTVAITAPKTPIPGTITLTGTAADNAGVAEVRIALNGGAPQKAALATAGAPKTTFSLAGIALENGKNTIVAQSVDSSGNLSAPSILAVTYVNARPALAGVYNGLLVPAVMPASDNNFGFVTLTVGVTGTVTGKVTLGGVTLPPINGIVGNDGTVHFSPTLATTFLLRATPTATPLGNLALTVAEDPTTGSKATGTLSSDTVVANLDAPRAFFDGKTPDTSVSANYLVNKGVYTVILPSKAQAGGPDKSTYPQGDGIATLTVTKAGAVSLNGTLADGTPIMIKSALTKDYRVPLFEALYKTGAIGGVVKLDDTQTDSDLKALDVLWIRPAISTSKYYPQGWNAGIKVDLLGAKYVVPVPVTGAPPQSVFPNLNASIPAGTTNATLEFSDGALGGNGTLTKSVHIDGTNAVHNIPATDKSFSLALTAATGGAAGMFTHTDLTKPAYKAVIYQKGTTAGAYGFFLSTPPKAVTGMPAPTGFSGGVTILATP